MLKSGTMWVNPTGLVFEPGTKLQAMLKPGCWCKVALNGYDMWVGYVYKLGGHGYPHYVTKPCSHPRTAKKHTIKLLKEFRCLLESEQQAA